MYKFRDETMRVPCYVWAEKGQIEDGAIEQISDASKLPFVFHHTVLCPDGHQGYGVPIGGVVATKDVIVPNFVGVDIGCGVCSFKTDLSKDDISIDMLKNIMTKIRQQIPLGFNHHNNCQEWDGFDKAPDIEIVKQQINSAKKQLGTLGGGNHFIEIQKDSDGIIYVMLHSGSRNFGLSIARHFHNKAIDLCHKWYSDIPNKDLSFLPLDTEEAQDYLLAMNYALSFAEENRNLMMKRIEEIMWASLGCSFCDKINVHHNYAALENHFDSNVIVHRKGAIRAREGDIGLIPGSQGTKSYIVRGKGSHDSFMSCSHGAGRQMSRTAARNNLDLDEEITRLDDMDIIHAIRGKNDLDEAAGAYKDISVVMGNQTDLVEIVTELSPVAVIKA